jgi:outer membrane receptor protein involved in Fe transport
MRLTVFLFFCLNALFSFAQPPVGQTPPKGEVPAIGSLDGQVFDSIARKPMEYVELRLCKQSDSTIVTGIYTDENGKFVLEQIPLGAYFMRVSQAGYKEKVIRNIQLTQAKPLRKLGSISLVSDAKDIEVIEITAETQVLQSGIDKKVYNVGEDLSVQGGSANDVLNNIPSIEVDQDGNISLRGEGNVTILIDGRPSSLSGGNGKNLLSGIPAASIERIEIVTNPSAKYDPDGTAGIINVVLKKNIRLGLNGNVALSAATGNAYTGSTSMNMRNTKFNIFGNYAYDYKEGYRNNFSDLDQTYGDSTVFFDQRRYGTDFSETHTAKIGMDLYLKDRNTLSWTLSGNLGARDRFGDQDNYRYNESNDTVGVWNRTSFDPGYNRNLDLGLNYTWEFKEDKGTIDWAAYQSLGNTTNAGYYEQTYDDPSYGRNLDQRLFSLEKNNITTLQMDVVRMVKSKWRTESGLKLIHRNMGVDTHSDSRDTAGVYQADTLAFFNYEYTERIYSAYGIVGRAINKWKFQLGLRLEQSYQEPNLISKNESYSNNYFNVFPSGHIRYEIKKGTELSLGYSKRINRPSSDNLNPFTSYADPYNLRRGNPALRPEYIHSVDFSFDYTQKKWSVTASAYQRYSLEVIQRVKVFYADGTSAGTFANINSSTSSGGELIFQFRPLPIWRNTLSANGNYVIYKDDNPSANWNRQGFIWGMKYSSSVELWKRTLTLQVNGRYNAPSITAQGRMQPRGSVEFSAEKSFKEGKWAVGMRVSDIFNTQGFYFVVEQPTITQSSEFKWLTRRFYVSLRYKFGRSDFTDRKKPGDQQGGGGGFDF